MWPEVLANADCQKHPVENQPGFGSFVLTVTEGERNQATTVPYSIPVIGFGSYTPEQRSEIIFNYIQTQRQQGTPVAAWREGAHGPCSFFVIAESWKNPVLQLTKIKKKYQPHPQNDYRVLRHFTIQEQTITVNPRKLYNYHFLEPAIGQNNGQPVTTQFTITGQTPTGQPLKATLSFQPSQR